MKFMTLAGEFSLEGGGDAGTSDTLFNLVATFEGELGCTADNTNTATDSDGNVIGEITRHQNTNYDPIMWTRRSTRMCFEAVQPDCTSASDASVTFDVADPVSPAQKAAYDGDTHVRRGHAGPNPFDGTPDL